MYLEINKWVIAVKVSNFSGQHLCNHWTLDIGVLGYIGIVWPKEHSPEVRSFPPGSPCIYMCVCVCVCVCLFSHIKVCTYAHSVQEKERWGRFWTVEVGSNRRSENITQKLHSLYSKPNISGMIRSMRIRCAGHLLCMWCRQMHTGFRREA